MVGERISHRSIRLSDHEIAMPPLFSSNHAQRQHVVPHEPTAKSQRSPWPTDVSFDVCVLHMLVSHEWRVVDLLELPNRFLSRECESNTLGMKTPSLSPSLRMSSSMDALNHSCPSMRYVTLRDESFPSAVRRHC